MLEGSLHILHELVGIHHAGNLHDGRQHGGVGEVLPQLFFGDLACVNGADPALIALQMRAQLRGGLAGVDDDGAFLLQSGGHIHSGEQGLVHHHHVIGEIDVGVNGAALRADAVVCRDGGAHPLGAVLREPLDVLARVEGRVRQQQGRRLCALAAPAVPADLYDVFHV